MMHSPDFYSKDLTQTRLRIVCENLLDAIDEAKKLTDHPLSMSWHKGTTFHAIPYGMVRHMHLDKNLDWFSLANKTMDYTARIGNTLVQFIVDDPHAPKKAHRLEKNLVERNQLSLNLDPSNNQETLVWRFYLNLNSNGVDFSPSISLLGFDYNKNIVCTWEHDVETIVGATFTKVPKASEIEEPLVKRKAQRKLENTSE